MFYVTGDTHGDFREVVRFCNRHALSQDDTVIVLGDAGINYFGTERDRKPRELLQKTPATIFCIHGNHERRPHTMSEYRETTWQGGAVYVQDEYPTILFAKDGEIFDFDGFKVIVIGGAYSPDKYYRLSHDWSWFDDEQPDGKTKEYVEAQLEKNNWKVDIVLTHTCPRKYEPTEAFIQGLDQSTVDKTTEMWLDSIEERVQYKHWYCGHFHIAKRRDKLQFMYKDFDVLRTNNSAELQLRRAAYKSESQNLYTSNLHLGHANIIRLCNRPFVDIEEMARVLIDNWNARVRSIDHIYVIGDLAFRSSHATTQYLEQLQGHKHLITGNHDKSWMKHVDLSHYFESVDMMREIKDQGQRVLLSHYPLMAWPGKGSYMIYGHIHANKDSRSWSLLRTMDRALNASVEVNGYQPATLNELIENNVVFRQ